MIVDKFNISLIPDKNGAKLIEKLSKEVFDLIGGFKVDNINKYAHLTLYRAQFPINNFEKLLAKTEKFQEAYLNPIILKVTGISVLEGYVMLEVEIPDRLKNLHIDVLNKFSDLRNGYIASKLLDKNYLSGLTHEEVENIKEYGQMRVNNLFNPHITLTKVDKNQKIPNLSHLLDSDLTITFDELCLCKGRKNGVCTDILI